MKINGTTLNSFQANFLKDLMGDTFLKDLMGDTFMTDVRAEVQLSKVCAKYQVSVTNLLEAVNADFLKRNDEFKRLEAEDTARG